MLCSEADKRCHAVYGLWHVGMDTACGGHTRTRYRQRCDVSHVPVDKMGQRS